MVFNNLVESLLELIIAKDSLKIHSPTLEQISTHKFFKLQNDQIHVESSINQFELPSKDSILKALQKSEQRLKDEQKLVKSQKRMTQNQKMMTSEEEKRKQNKQKLKPQNSLQTGPINFKINLSECIPPEGKNEDSPSKTN